MGFTTGYEDWLASRIPLVPADLAAKHTEMTGSVLRFLRGTYYLCLRRVADLQPWLEDAVGAMAADTRSCHRRWSRRPGA